MTTNHTLPHILGLTGLLIAALALAPAAGADDFYGGGFDGGGFDGGWDEGEVFEGDLEPTTGFYWAMTYGGTSLEDAASVQKTWDGGAIVGGSSSSGSSDLRSATVFKLDAWGQVEWFHYYDAGNDDVINEVRQTADGGYIAVGGRGWGAGHSEVWVLKLDSTGAITWQKTYGGGSAGEATSVRQTSDGGYVIVGTENGWEEADGVNTWILKTESWGWVEWQRTYSMGHITLPSSLDLDSNGHYLLSGTVTTEAHGWDAWVLKIDHADHTGWGGVYGGSGDDQAAAFRPTPDGYVMAGTTTSFGDRSAQGWILKFHRLGMLVWQRAYGGAGHDAFTDIEVTDANTFVVTGFTDSWGAGSSDLWLVELGPQGEALESRTWGGPADDYASAIDVAWDADITVAGSTNSFGSGSYDNWVLRLEPSGEIQNCEICSVQSLARQKTDGVNRYSGNWGLMTAAGPTPGNASVEAAPFVPGIVCQD